MIKIVDFNNVKMMLLSALHDVKEFDCGDEDTNEFLKNDALIYQEKKIASTFIFVYSDQIIGYFCCASDSIRLKGSEKNDSKLSNKSLSEFPAMKICRLARDHKFRDNNIGQQILNLAIAYAESQSLKVAIRFVTLDSYTSRLKMYEKLGFKKNLHTLYDKKANVSMRLDLLDYQG